MKRRRGKFITLEGGEGAGKSTQARRLARYLRRKGMRVILTREVGGAPGAEKIRKVWLEEGEGYWDPIAELFLIFAARREHLAKTILPALKRGVWVVSDRFMDSTRAYQGMVADADLKQIERLYKEVALDFEPDLTLLLDVPVKTSMERVKKRGGWNDRYQLKAAPFHRKLRKQYLALSKKHRRRFEIIDAGQNTEEVARSIAAVVSKRMRIKKK